MKRARRYDGVVPKELNGVGQLEGVEKKVERVGKNAKSGNEGDGVKKALEMVNGRRRKQIVT